jgi:signal peptidase I
MRPMCQDDAGSPTKLDSEHRTAESGQSPQHLSQDQDAPPESRFWSIIREVAETVILAVAIWLAINFLTARYVVDGPSMEDNLRTGQRLIVSRIAYKFSSPQRGDVVVFRSTQNPEENIIKRVIGLPGETLVIDDGKVYVDGLLLDEAYVSSSTFLPYKGKWTIPEGYYFVMGDNRAHSSDSRRQGLIPAENIIGKAWISYWPPGEIRPVRHYNDYASNKALGAQ